MRPMTEEIVDDITNLTPEHSKRFLAIESMLEEALETGTAAGLENWLTNCKVGAFEMPNHQAYWLLDRLLASEAPPADKINLLVRLLKENGETHSMNLITEVLLCRVDQAFPSLMEQFWQVSVLAEVYRCPWTLYALCRTGSRFVESLLKPLMDPSRRPLALAGLEALFRSYPSCSLPTSAPSRPRPPSQLALDKRRISNYAPVSENQMQEELLQTLVSPLTRLLTDQEDEPSRNRALRLLGALNLAAQQPVISQYLKHPLLSTRLAAIRALASMSAVDSAGDLIDMAKSGEPSERYAAIETLGRLQVAEARPVLKQCLEQKDRQLGLVAVTALGEIGAVEDGPILQRVIASSEKPLAKAAAKALHRQTRTRQPSPATRQRLNKIRGTEQPAFHTSLPAVIRALPKIQPYEENDLTRRIAQVCSDYATTRRYLVMDKSTCLMRRSGGIYEFTQLGQAVWRVEHHIQANYLKPPIDQK